jgi:cytidylate kinase
MIVTIDGPAGAGKSSVARRLAQRLGFQFLDTGAMYRAVAWALANAHVDLQDESVVTAFLDGLRLEMQGPRVSLNGHDITPQLRDAAVSQAASRVAAIPVVRAALVRRQREIAEQGDYVCEGRDQGTVVFPDAVFKVFLTGSPEIRAERRWREMREQDPAVSLDDVVAEQKIRDLRDETRAVGRLQKAADAVEINVDRLTLEEVVDHIEQLVRAAVADAG